MKMAYNQINKQYDQHEAAYRYLEDSFGHHVPYMFPDLIPHLIRCLDVGASETQFKRDAKTMYNI
ncbi:hypothetical protein [Pseudomonas paracarnis]|uniref:hypothetical protein n=1 Tax=Pseudomonas paracarnis TaxID=2750625 RepID=UPI002FDF40A5